MVGLHRLPYAQAPICTGSNMHRLPYAQAPICTGSNMHRLQYAQALICTGSNMHRLPYAQAPICTGSHMHRLQYAQAPICTGSMHRLPMHRLACAFCSCAFRNAHPLACAQVGPFAHPLHTHCTGFFGDLPVQHLSVFGGCVFGMCRRNSGCHGNNNGSTFRDEIYESDKIDHY